MVGGAYRRSGWVLRVQSHHGDPNERDKSVYDDLDSDRPTRLVDRSLSPDGESI